MGVIEYSERIRRSRIVTLLIVFIVSRNVITFPQWTNMTATMPDLDKNDPEDVKELKAAESQIGDYKLKRNSVFVRNIENRTTTTVKFHEVLNVRKEIDSIRRNYNWRVFELRDEKQQLVLYAQAKLRELEAIHGSLQPHMRKTISFIPEMVDDKEYPQKVFDVSIFFRVLLSDE